MTNVPPKSGLIKKPSELVVSRSIKVLIYGQPGIGKTTLALSSPSPLLVDFDNGVHRVDPMHQGDTVQVDSWQNMLDLLNNEDLSSYKTLVIDTAGKMLDFMSNYLIANNPKLGKQNGALTLQGYGERKAEFIAFLKKVSQMGKNIVFVAHDKEDREGDQKIIRPEIGGSSAGDLIKELDLVGYMEAVGQKRTISFDPCEKFYGKNTCKLPRVMELADVVTATEGKTVANIRLTSIFDTYLKSLEERKEVAVRYNNLITDLKTEVDAIKNAKAANAFIEKMANAENHIWDSKLQASLMLKVKAETLGLIMNKTSRKYEDKPVEKKEPVAKNTAKAKAEKANGNGNGKTEEPLRELTDQEKAEIEQEEKTLFPTT